LCPRLVKVVKESGLVCVSYGTLNNDPSNVKRQVNEGIDAVIVDSVLAIRKGLTDSENRKMEQKEQQDQQDQLNQSAASPNSETALSPLTPATPMPLDSEMNGLGRKMNVEELGLNETTAPAPLIVADVS
jgi:hypothetical protein